mgnify:CR=1 FL=1
MSVGFHGENCFLPSYSCIILVMSRSIAHNCTHFWESRRAFLQGGCLGLSKNIRRSTLAGGAFPRRIHGNRYRIGVNMITAKEA